MRPLKPLRPAKPATSATSAISACKPAAMLPSEVAATLRPVATSGLAGTQVAGGRSHPATCKLNDSATFAAQVAEVAEVAGSNSRGNSSDDPFLIPTCDGGPTCIPLELPPLDAPLGKCRGCTFIAPMSPRGLCGACEFERQCAP